MADVAYIYIMPEKIIWPFLVVLDTMSRYVYTTSLVLVNPAQLKNAFLKLFRQGMPYFPVIRVDQDPSFKSLLPFFAKKKMLLRVKRGPHKLHLIEPKIKLLKAKLIKHLRMHPEDFSDGRRRSILEETTKSINHTRTVHDLVPAEVNSPIFDPFLRAKLYPHTKIQPFEKFLTEQLRLQRKVNQPNSSAQQNFKEGPNDFSINDTVQIDYNVEDRIRSSYAMQRGNGPIYRVSKVDTTQPIWIYRLKDLNNHDIDGWFYGSELSRVSLDSLQVEKVLKSRRAKDGRQLDFVKFKNYDR